MFARPKPGESEEEILARQNKFLAEKQENQNFQPAAKLVNPRKHEGSQTSYKDPKQPKLSENEDDKCKMKPSSNEENMEDDKVYFPQPLPCILGDIVEKNVGISSEPPTVLSPHVQKTSEKGSKSIFSQRMKDKKLKNTNTPNTTKHPEISTSKFAIKENIQNCVLKNEDAMEIDSQNKSLLESMTPEEIFKEREEIMSKMDPKILMFLQARNNKNSNQNLSKKNNEIQAESSTENVKSIIDDNLLDNEIISHPELKKWVHFDKIEEDKLEWIKNIEPANIPAGDAPYEARFDFKGYLLPYTIEYTEETKVLFHHGEESHRPGYTLNELFQLSRSTVIQQRSLALGTIAGILEYNSLGVYSRVIDIPITKTFFVLRFALDENIQTVLEPSLRALRNMLYNRVDETCLDNCLGTENGLFQPRILSNQMETDETETDVTELKDFHLADLDLISGAIRTDILPRIRYILFVIKPSYLCLEYSLQILIRIARDSIENVQKLMEVYGLLDNIFKEYIPQNISTNNNSEYHKLVIIAMKLFRIIICQSKSFAEVFESKFSFIDTLLNYVSFTSDTIYLMKIQSEAYNILSIYTKYDINSFKLESIILLLLKAFDWHVKSIDMTSSCSNCFFYHSTHLLIFLSNILTVQSSASHIISLELIKHFGDLLVQGGSKWCSQIVNVETPTSAKLNLISAVLMCFNTLHKLGYESNLVDISKFNTCMHNMISSQSFLMISRNLSNCSNLLSKHDNKLNDAKASNVPNLNAINLNNSHKLQPILNDMSPFCFVSSVCKYLTVHQNFELSYYFFNLESIMKYSSEFQSSKINYLCDNWFTRTELEFLFNLITLSIKLKCSEMQMSIIYNVSFKLSYTLTNTYKSELRFLFKNIIFNKAWFTADRLLKNLNIDESSDVLNHLHSIMKCYYYSLNLNNSENFLNFTVVNWNQAILPRDWIYMPILGLYSKNHDSVNMPPEKDFMKKDVICCCLKWIFISETFFADLTNEIDLTDRFCRILCIFLCDNSLFLDSKIKLLLQKCIQIIFDLEKSLPTSKKLNFDKPLIGITNFQDLYMQLVDQFQAVSYGDTLFASCVMVPLSRRHNIKWRKIVWSEYAACLRSLDCPENMLCYPLDDYLSPPETDLSLLKNYHSALKNHLLRAGTITYKIANHHIEAVKLRTK